MTEKWRARAQTARARIWNPLSGGQCHLIHLTILRSWILLAEFSLYVHTDGLKPPSFNLISDNLWGMFSLDFSGNIIPDRFL